LLGKNYFQTANPDYSSVARRESRPLLKPAQYLRGLPPQSHETSRDLFHYFWPASGRILHYQVSDHWG
jgi:hypothetical protein